MSGLVLQTMKSSCMVFSLKQYVSGLAVRQRKIGCAAAPGGLQGKKIRVQKISVEYLSFQGGDLLPMGEKKR
jgi:hypothetical protein